MLHSLTVRSHHKIQTITPSSVYFKQFRVQQNLLILIVRDEGVSKYKYWAIAEQSLIATHLKGCLFIPSGRRWETIPLRTKPYSNWAVALIMKTWASWREQIILKHSEWSIWTESCILNQLKFGNAKIFRYWYCIISRTICDSDCDCTDGQK